MITNKTTNHLDKLKEFQLSEAEQKQLKGGAMTPELNRRRKPFTGGGGFVVWDDIDPRDDNDGKLIQMVTSVFMKITP